MKKKHIFIGVLIILLTLIIYYMLGAAVEITGKTDIKEIHDLKITTNEKGDVDVNGK